MYRFTILSSEVPLLHRWETKNKNVVISPGFASTGSADTGGTGGIVVGIGASEGGATGAGDGGAAGATGSAAGAVVGLALAGAA